MNHKNSVDPRVHNGLKLFLMDSPFTVGRIAYICFKWFQITADAHPGVSWVSNDLKFFEKFKNTHCQVDHPAKIE